MESDIINRILEKAGHSDLLDILARRISFSDLNSLLLEVYKIRAEETTPADLLAAYRSNRFVKPADENPLEVLALEREILKLSASFSFVPLNLSPVAPLGSCSAIAAAHQNKVISALRGTEVVADATNFLALHICSLKKEGMNRALSGTDEKMRYCTLHRHVRAQKYNNPRSLPHFKLFCMVTAGRDTGSYRFEEESLLEHVQVYNAIFKEILGFEDVKYKLIRCGAYPDSGSPTGKLACYLQEKLPGKAVDIVSPAKADNPYYRDVQFKIYVHSGGRELEAADGGFVDWSQKLLGNKKERMLVSGLGIGLLLQMMNRS